MSPDPTPDYIPRPELSSRPSPAPDRSARPVIAPPGLPGTKRSFGPALAALAILSAGLAFALAFKDVRAGAASALETTLQAVSRLSGAVRQSRPSPADQAAMELLAPTSPLEQAASLPEPLGQRSSLPRPADELVPLDARKPAAQAAARPDRPRLRQVRTLASRNEERVQLYYAPVKPPDQTRVVPPCSWSVVRAGGVCVNDQHAVTTQGTSQKCSRWGATDCMDGKYGR